ncbi:sulfotransferase [Dyella sp. ASV21]|uniref:sulfotransferase n=1 Tax=Dyella sp. ASV21 TaxID=2795114 RepID=UPI0018ED1653|nr:sulfotransferase [Dyella sp. ASV21]
MAPSVAPASQPVLKDLDAQGLFVIGAARSGTTVLQNALNDSHDVFLFGEPSFHDDPGSADFARRYNGMHRAWGNQENKSSFCPPLFDGDATWRHYLDRLASMHRYVGSKIVINPEHAARACESVFDFQCRNFYRAHYIFTFRHPVDVLMSTRGLAELSGYEAVSHEVILGSFLRIMGLYIRMLRNLPFVTSVFHEHMDARAFRQLGSWLDIDLARAASYYDDARVRHYSMEQLPGHVQPLAADVVRIYEDLRAQAEAGFDLIQLEQNAGNFSPGHATALGALNRRIEQRLASV